MIIQNHVETYHDDEEIIDILVKIPPLQEHGNQTILGMMERNIGSDFGMYYKLGKEIIFLYKFDNKFFSPEDSGLIMLKAEAAYVDNLILHIEICQKVGMRFSTSIMQEIMSALKQDKSAIDFLKAAKLPLP